MRSLMITVVLALAATTTACASGSSTGSPLAGGARVEDFAAMSAEYHSLADRYPWPLPGGVTFPAELPRPPEETLYEVGEGRNQADSFWICSWMGSWIAADAGHRPRKAATAWRWVQRADETQLHTEHYDDPTDIWHREILGPAAHGDPRPVRDFYVTSCGYPGLPPLRRLIDG